MAGNIILETERLVLRQLDITDTAFIIQLLNSPGWLTFIGDRDVKTTAAARRYLLDGPLKSYAAHGFGLYLVELRGEGIPMGMCGLLKRDELPCPDIGFAFLPEFTGLGFALEIAAATLRFARDTLHLSRIAAITLPENARSIGLLKKLGFEQDGKMQPAKGGEELLLFGLLLSSLG